MFQTISYTALLFELLPMVSNKVACTSRSYLEQLVSSMSSSQRLASQPTSAITPTPSLPAVAGRLAGFIGYVPSIMFTSEGFRGA